MFRLPSFLCSALALAGIALVPTSSAQLTVRQAINIATPAPAASTVISPPAATATVTIPAPNAVNLTPIIEPSAQTTVAPTIATPASTSAAFDIAPAPAPVKPPAEPPLDLSKAVGVLVMVDDIPITDLDLAYRINLDLATSNQANTNSNRARIAEDSLENLINDAVKIGAAEQRGITIGQRDLDRGLQDIAGQNGQTPDEFFATLQSQGVPAQTFFTLLRAQFAWRSLSRAEVATMPDISEQAINDEISRLNSLRGRRERLMGEIFLPYSRFATEADAMAAANELLRQLRTGSRFTDVAAENSFAPTATNGGRMGWVVEGSLDPQAEERLARLYAGQITQPPIAGRDGVYIYAVQQSRPVAVSNSKTTVRLLQMFRNIPLTAQSEASQQAIMALNTATVTMRSCDDFQRYIDANGDVGSGDMGMVDLAMIPQNISQALATLPIGMPSVVLPVDNGASVFMVCARTQEIDDDVREGIESRLQAQQRATMLRRFERDLRRQTLIDYRF